MSLKFDESLQQTASAEVLKEIKDRCDEVYKLREAATEAENLYKAKKKELLEIMEAAGVDKFTGDLASVNTKVKTSVSCPKDMKAKSEFFQYIATEYGKGVLNDLLTINSNTLSAWHTKELEKKAAEGDLDFKVPGLEPYTYPSLGITKRRKKKGE